MEGISNSIWGPIYWKMLHYVTLTYPLSPKEEDKQRIKLFFTDIVPNILPCPFCREHLKNNLIKFPLSDDILEIKFKLVIWLINLHNYINKQLGKNVMTIENALVSLFMPSQFNYENIELNNHHQEYNKDKLKKMAQNIIFTQSDDFIFNIDALIKEKENDIKNKKELDDYLKKVIEEEKKNKKEEKILSEKEKEKINKNIELYNAQMDNLRKQMEKKKKMNELPDVEIEQQSTINLNLIIDQIYDLIEQQNNQKTKQQLATALESICLIF
jgi:hypothetical protein